MELDLSLSNDELYQGIKINEVGGKRSVDLSDDVLNMIGRNASKIIDNCTDREQLILTGASAIPIYLVVFHHVVHRFKKVRFKNEMYDLNISRH